MLTSSLLAELQTPSGAQALAAARNVLQTESDYLRAVQRVARQVRERLARAAVEQELLRRRATAKFTRAADLFFTREALEQASSELVAAHRAHRFSGAERVVDLGAGLGGDSLALARHTSVVAIDHDRLRLALLLANARVLGLEAHLHALCADILDLPLRVPPGAHAFADPGRRRSGRRLKGVRNYDPPLEALLAHLPGFSGMGVKLSPAVRREEIEGLPCELEFVSVRRELKEAVLWFGDLRRGSHRATVLPSGSSLEAAEDVPPPIRPLRSFLVEPDPAVLRAGLVHTLGRDLGAAPIAPGISFLTLDHPPESPFARVFRVVRAAPFRLKTLQEWMREARVGTLTVKRRGSAVDPRALWPRLRLEGEAEAVVILTRLEGRQSMILVTPVESGEAAGGEAGG